MALSSPNFPNLAGRAEALEALGWTGRDAEWIALVCLHSGVFARSHFCHHYQCHPSTAMRFVQRLADARVAAEHPLPDTRTNQKLCHIHDKSVYRLLGIRDVRHRRWPREGVLWRRLLSFDAVLESPGLNWLPTEEEKVRYFTSCGVGRDRLPKRVYGGPGASTTRYFVWKLPIAGDPHRATFVYVDRGLDSRRQLRRWCAEHEPLWATLRETGVEVHVHAVARTRVVDQRTAAFLAHHQTGRTAPSSGGLSPDEQATLARLDAALDANDQAALRQWGGLLAAARTAGALRDRANALERGRAAHIDRVRTYVATRVADDVYAA